MLRSTFGKLRKIADEAPKLPAPVPELVLDVLGKTESGYDRYTNDDFNRRYIRTRIRGTHGDPRIPKKKWTSSTAYGPWQVNLARSADIAKYDPAYAKLHNSKLYAMYKEMARTGLGGYWYDQYTKKGLLPKGFTGKYVSSYDYGGHPFDVDSNMHDVVRGGMLKYVSKKMIPDARLVGGKDVEKQWKAIASMHHLGHDTPNGAEEIEKFNKYWGMLKPNIDLMLKNRAAWKKAQLDKWNKRKEVYNAMDPRANTMLPLQLKAIENKITEFSRPGY